MESPLASRLCSRTGPLRFPPSLLAPGQSIITAGYGGDSVYAASSTSLTETVRRTVGS